MPAADGRRRHGDRPDRGRAFDVEHAPDDHSLAEDDRQLAATERRAHGRAGDARREQGDPPRAQGPAREGARQLDGLAAPAAGDEQIELLVGSPLGPGLVAPRQLGAEQVVEALDVPAARQHAGLPLDVVRTAVGLGRSRELAERLEIRSSLGELRAPRRRHRDGRCARQHRQSPRLAHPCRLVRPPGALEEPRGSHQLAPQLGAPRERERARARLPAEGPVEKIGHPAQEPTLSPFAPCNRSCSCVCSNIVQRDL